MQGTVVTSKWKRGLWRVAAGLCLAAVLLAGSLELIVPRVWQTIADRQVMSLLTSPTEQERKQGAWRAASRAPGADAEFIKAQLAGGHEPDAGVRESFVYALGRLRLRDCYPLLARTAREDPSGYVRQAAWVAAARVDFAQFCEAARAVETADDTWGRMGVAAALLEGGDPSQLEFLLDLAAGSDDFQRKLAGVALYRYLRPLLRAAGRWPLTTDISAEGVWSVEFVEEIRHRAAPLKLTEIATYCWPEQQGTESLRRMIRRIYGARARVVRMLYSFEPE